MRSSEPARPGDLEPVEKKEEKILDKNTAFW
jgi:hypothetical protein